MTAEPNCPLYPLHFNLLNLNNILQEKTRQVWVKPVEPVVGGQQSYAVVYIDSNNSGDKYSVSING